MTRSAACTSPLSTRVAKPLLPLLPSEADAAKLKHKPRARRRYSFPSSPKVASNAASTAAAAGAKAEAASGRPPQWAVRRASAMATRAFSRVTSSTAAAAERRRRRWTLVPRGTGRLRPDALRPASASDRAAAAERAATSLRVRGLLGVPRSRPRRPPTSAPPTCATSMRPPCVKSEGARHEPITSAKSSVELSLLLAALSPSASMKTVSWERRAD
mmetsp:Transcript_98954/g.317297  ORF Transcript_98954/g.317297 Transcript_98954/m.317297 type:complete len:216 (-) Transcript_98954:324-971(-)